MDIAIVGMGCRYPGGAHSPEELWELVSSGRDTWSEVPQDRFNAAAFYHPDPEAPEAISQKGGHFLSQELADFDPGFFAISAPEAEAVDPLQRIVLETAWEAVESAGVTLDQFRGSNTAVYMAMFGHDAEQLVHKDVAAFNRYQDYGITRPLLANRLSYLFDLHGPSAMLDTACSGSLVAIHLACQALRLGEASAAIAGGVGLIFSPDQMALMSLVGVFNTDGRSYTWDERGNGYGRGEGVGVVLLKRLEDALTDGDPIRAVIRSSAVNQDGKTNGISLPSQVAQESLARDVFRGLDFSHAAVQYAEAHGTGTKAGDQIEMQAIRAVLAAGRDADLPLFVGAIKSNIGHSEAASGVAGLIRTVLAMEKGQIAPQALLDRFKTGLEPEGWNITIPRELAPWPSTGEGRRRAVVSSFGFGGTNAMLVLESATAAAAAAAQHRQTPSSSFSNGEKAPRPHLLVMSAKSEHSAVKTIQRLKTYIESNPSVDLGVLSHTLANKRSHFPWRFATVAADTPSLLQALSPPEAHPKHVLATGAKKQNLTAFVFTGQGAQWAQMGHRLLTTIPVFRESIEDSDQYLRSQLGADWSLIEELSRDESSTRLYDSRFGQPISTAVQVGLVDVLRSWGVVPAAVLGHSSGEIAAAYAAGALSRHGAMLVSYHRSFLAEAARQRVVQPGAMMAVGLGEEAVAKYLRDHDNNLVAACINSPSSITLSGDEDAIIRVENALRKDGVFQRRLKVDTAYHSHHMKSVAQDYLERLDKGGLETSNIGSDSDGSRTWPRFFSTVNEAEKRQDFGAAYWVSNLVSPVRFAGALQRMVDDLGASGSSGGSKQVVNIVEVGPHKALAGPIRQTLHQLSPHTYIPSLERGRDCFESLLTTRARLYEAGIIHGPFGTELDAAFGSDGANVGPAVLTNLPPYAWDHTTQYWAESRLSHDYRFRQHGYHDLLGSRVTTSPATHPSWRMLLSHDRLPWLRDHMVDDVPVFPATAYMTMAIQALAQLLPDADEAVRGYNLRGMTFKNALVIPKDARKSIEVIMTFRHHDDDSYNFVISSPTEQGSKWLDHCAGNIRPSSHEIEVFGGDDVVADPGKDNSHVVVLGKEELYERLAALGNYYGPSFAVSTGPIRLGAFRGESTVEIPDIASIMPAGYLQPHIIHPTVLDGMLQAALPVFMQHAHAGSVMPSYIADVFVSADIVSQKGHCFDVLCELSDTFPRSTNFDIKATQRTAGGPSRCVVSISGGEALVVGDASSAKKESLLVSEAEAERIEREEKGFIWTSKWGLDMTSITADMLESVVVPLQSDEAGLTQGEKVNLLDAMAARYIDDALGEIERDLGGNDAIAKDFRQHQWRSFQKLASSPNWQGLLGRVAQMEELGELARRLGAEGEALHRIGSKLAQILTGQADALGLLLEDQLLFRIYHGDEGARASQYMADYAAHLSFQRPGLRILEIGAGTGGTTAKVLKACNDRTGGDRAFCAEYMFTDISSGFFEGVRSGLLKPWAHMLKFQALDLEMDPVEQGFEPYSYDLVIAANVVHATRSIRESLRRARKLLKPGGILGLVELTKPLVSGGMIFGCLEGWWAGTPEGRVDGPVQNAEQWDGHLLAAGFSGVDLAAYDLPEPQRHSALLLSTALPEDAQVPLPAPPPIHILSALPETASNAHLVESLALKLSNVDEHEHRRRMVATGDWADPVVDDDRSYVILDSAETQLITHATSQRFTGLMTLLNRATRVYWVTFAKPSEAESHIAPDNALVTGLVRVARNENSRLLCFTLDVQDDVVASPEAVRDGIVKLVRACEARIEADLPLELEFSLRGGLARIQRLVSEPALDRLVSDDGDGDDDHVG